MDALSQTAAQVGLDHSFYVLFALVVCLHIILSSVYLKPYQNLILRRKQKTEGASKEAETLTLQANERGAQYKQRLRETNETVRNILKQVEDLAKKEEARLVSEASLRGKAILQNAQKDSEHERKTALDSASEDISTIANSIATKVLGRSVSAR